VRAARGILVALKVEGTEPLVSATIATPLDDSSTFNSTRLGRPGALLLGEGGNP